MPRSPNDSVSSNCGDVARKPSWQRLIAVVEARGIWGHDGHLTVKGYLRANANWSNQDVARSASELAVDERPPCRG